MISLIGFPVAKQTNIPQKIAPHNNCHHFNATYFVITPAAAVAKVASAPDHNNTLPAIIAPKKLPNQHKTKNPMNFNIFPLLSGKKSFAV